MPLYISDNDINDFNKEQEVILTNNGSKGKMIIWSAQSCGVFKQYFNDYTSAKNRGDINTARLKLSLAIAEFQEIKDAPLYYNSSLISKVKAIAENLQEEINFIIRRIEAIPSANPDQTIMRRALTFESKYVSETIRLCNLAQVIRSEKSTKEKLCDLASEHPYLFMIGGVVIGIAIGAAIYCVAPIALAKLPIVITAGKIKAISASAAIAATLATIAADGIILYNAKSFSESIRAKRIYKANGGKLRRLDLDLEAEIEAEKDIEIELQEDVSPANDSHYANQVPNCHS